ncbi:hypothetical protein ACP70R_030240 [Stipagrostis hirtigluma subsp. patula]
MEALARWCYPPSSGLTAFSHRLTKQLSAGKDCPAADGENRSGNLVFSPLSMYSALSMVAAGAQGNTLTELLDALGARSRDKLSENVRFMVERALPVDGEQKQPEGAPRVEHACGIWHDATRALKPAYRDAAAASCRAVARAVDFISKPEEARRQINSWVAAATSNLVDSILSPGSVTKDTRLVVTSAVYFKGSWAIPFDKDWTKEFKFHRLDGSAVEAPFMRSSSRQFVAVHDGFKVLKMPYKAMHEHDPLDGLRAAVSAVIPKTMPPPPQQPPRYAMCVFLPDRRDGLWSLEDRMASSPAGFLQKHMPKRRVEVGNFRVPRFKISFYTSVKRVLRDLGVKAVFDPSRAELPEMLEDGDPREEPLFLEDVYHKAVIEVNEEGTEAAAATVCDQLVAAGYYRRPEPVRVDFVADHPFAFFVVEEESGAILFAGHVLDPTQS